MVALDTDAAFVVENSGANVERVRVGEGLAGHAEQSPRMSYSARHIVIDADMPPLELIPEQESEELECLNSCNGDQGRFRLMRAHAAASSPAAKPSCPTGARAGTAAVPKSSSTSATERA